MAQEKRNLFLLGDSVSIHYRHYLTRYLGPGWTVRGKDGLADALDDLDFPIGANGGDSAMILNYLENDFPFDDTDILLLNCGLHDIKRYPGKADCQVPAESYKSNLRSVIRLCRKKDVELIWRTTTGFDEKRHSKLQRDFQRQKNDYIQYSRIARKLMNNEGIEIMDLNAFTSSLPNEGRFIDHVHFSIEVRKAQAEFIVHFLNYV